jgi:hypothetical protein
MRSPAAGVIDWRSESTDPRDERGTIMGDKSPKSVRKHETQKQAKNDAADQKKRQAIAAKQVPFKK